MYQMCKSISFTCWFQMSNLLITITCIIDVLLEKLKVSIIMFVVLFAQIRFMLMATSIATGQLALPLYCQFKDDYCMIMF